jgi:hypothetical protein
MGVLEIAEAAGLGNAVMSRRYRVIESLYRRGLIERVPDPRRDDWSLWQLPPKYKYYLVSKYAGVSIIAPLSDEDQLVAVNPTKLSTETLDRAADAAERGIKRIEIDRAEYLRAAGFID